MVNMVSRLKGTVYLKVKNTDFLLSVLLFLHLVCFDVTRRVLEILAVMELDGAKLVGLKASNQGN